MNRRRIVLGVTADASLLLLLGFPEFLRDKGWDVHVVSGPGPRLDEVSSLEGITAHPLPMRRNPSPFHDLLSLGRWISLLMRIRPAVISTGTPKAGLLGSIAARVSGVPARVYHLRGLRLETTSGAVFQVLRLFERVAAVASTRVLAVSPSLRDEFLSLGIAEPSKVHVLGSGSSNGVDLERFSPERWSAQALAVLHDRLGLADGTPTIGFVGRLAGDKGFHDLVAASRRLRDAGVIHQILVLGKAEDLDSSSLMPDDPVIMTGFVADPAGYYRLMDILCLPTYREGFPNVVLEAAAMGIPTVSTTATGAVDAVISGVTGWTVPIGDVGAITSALQIALEQPELRGSLGHAAQDRARAEFAREKVWESTEAFYRELTQQER